MRKWALKCRCIRIGWMGKFYDLPTEPASAGIPEANCLVEPVTEGILRLPAEVLD